MSATARQRLAEERTVALRWFEAGDYAQAARLLLALLARSPPDPLLLRCCGMALVRTGGAKQGLRYLAHARRLDPREPVAALWHGIALGIADLPRQALTELAAAAELAPSDPAPRVHLSRMLLKQGLAAAAADAAEAALTLAPRSPEALHALRLAAVTICAANTPEGGSPALAEAWLQLGLACVRLDNVTDARAALEQAVAMAPEHARAASELAMIEHLCGEPLTALRRLRDVVAAAPDAPHARLHLASRLLMDGDYDEALSLLEAAPDDAALTARWQVLHATALRQAGRTQASSRVLAQVAEPPGDAELLLRWQQMLRARESGDRAAQSSLLHKVATLVADRDASGLEDRVDTHFNLAELARAANQNRTAFSHWRQGHALMRRAQPFSRTEQAALVDAIIRDSSESRLRQGTRATRIDPLPVFIVGLPRTGTSLTEHILAAHRNVHAAGERLAVREALQHLRREADADDPDQSESVFDQLRLDTCSQAFLRDLHALAADAPGNVSRVVDKMPDNIFQLGFIARLLPGARIICCTRDLRDVGLSIFRHRFIGNHSYAHELGDLGFFIAQHQRLLRHWRAVLTLPMLEVDHAEWISDFDATLRRVLDFLGLDHDPACTRFYEQDRRVMTASRHQVGQPINGRGVGMWREHATDLAPMFAEIDRG